MEEWSIRVPSFIYGFITGGLLFGATEKCFRSVGGIILYTYWKYYYWRRAGSRRPPYQKKEL